MNKEEMKNKLLEVNIDNKIWDKINNTVSSGLEQYNDGLNTPKMGLFNFKKIIIASFILISIFSVYIIINKATGTKNLSASKINFVLDKDKVYFENFSDELKLYSMNFNGTNINKVSDDSVGDICIDNSQIYYVNYSNNSHIYRIDKNGSNKKELTKLDSDNINIVDGWLYFTSNSAVYKIKKTGEQSTLFKIYENDSIIEDTNKNIYAFKNKILIAQYDGLVLVNPDNKNSDYLFKIENDDEFIKIERVFNDGIYYSIGKKLYYFNYLNKSTNKISINNSTGIFCITDNDIYALTWDNKSNHLLAKIDIKTNLSKYFNLDTSFENFIIVQNKILGYNPSSGGKINLTDLDNLSSKTIIRSDKNKFK